MADPARLSSAQTFLMKFVIPTVSFAGILFVLLRIRRAVANATGTAPAGSVE